MSVSSPAPTLGTLRQEIDGIDDALHDLLMRRAGVVQRVADLTHAGKIPFRPGREADVIARLLARHTGPLPRHAVVRWWREMFAAHISIETPFTIAVADLGGSGDYPAAAREHFGSLTPLRIAASATNAIDEVRRGVATAAVLPMPTEHGPADGAWWIDLMDDHEPRVHIVGRLPFWAARPQGSPRVEAFVVAAAPPDRSRHDHTLIALTAPNHTDTGAVRAAVTGRGLEVAGMVWRGSAGMIDVAGHLGADDPRLAALGRVVILGGYAVPVGDR